MDLLLMVIFFCLGYGVSNLLWHRAIQDAVEHSIEEDDEPEEKLITIEKHSDTFLAYDKDNNFLLQSLTVETLVSELLAKYKLIRVQSASEEIKTDLLAYAEKISA